MNLIVNLLNLLSLLDWENNIEIVLNRIHNIHMIKSLELQLNAQY